MLISTWLRSFKERLHRGSRRSRGGHGAGRIGKAVHREQENLEPRCLLAAPTLLAVRPNVGEFLQPGETRHIAPNELTLQFNPGQMMDPAFVNTSTVQVQRAGHDGMFGDSNDEFVNIGYVGIGNVPEEIVVRFAENLPDDDYRILLDGTSGSPLQNVGGEALNDGADTTFDFSLDLGARIVAVDPQPVSRNPDGTLSQVRDQIVVYFNDDELDPVAAENRDFYQLIATKGTVSNLDDTVHLPKVTGGVVYDAMARTATLTFDDDIFNLDGAGTYRLRIGNDETIPLAPNEVSVGDAGDSFATADTTLGTLGDAMNPGNNSHLLQGSIDPQFYPYQFPGANDEPGHREVEVETHLNGGADTAAGISKRFYNFQDVYGQDPQGNDLHNLITENQKQRAREIFEIYSTLLGIDFVESDSSGLTIVTGDLRALDPMIPTGPGGVAGLAGGGKAIMDMAESWTDNAGGSWHGVAMHEIGHLLGQGHTYDLPEVTVQGTDGNIGAGRNVSTEPISLGDNDIVHGRHLHRPDSIDIDLYEFDVADAGLLAAEVVAERQTDASDLDAVLRLYKEDPVDGSRELIAQNDDYFSDDPFIELLLEPGKYFLGVSSTGNDAYDPAIANTGLNGTSDGVYDLRLNFRPNVDNTIVDVDGTAFDGDSDGVAGGVYNFWFNVADTPDNIFVDKAAISHLEGAVNTAQTNIEFQHVTTFEVNDVILIDSEQMQITAIDTMTNIVTVTRGFNATTPAAHADGRIIHNTAADGSLTNPFGLIPDALAAATAGDIVRIVGNGGLDENILTTDDNLPYQIGFNESGVIPLEDGSALEVPRGVTTMIDGGAVFKLHQSRIGAGSSSSILDRSGSSLQVLGTPEHNVIFTSWLNENIGTDTTISPTTAGPGNWGGLVFRNSVDRNQNRPVNANEGIFTNYVAHADITYGGGKVVVDNVLQTVNPIHLSEAQPTIAYNTITMNEDSAISADPDSFAELTFNSPRFQDGVPAFTSDYKRVGPNIHFNTITNNSTNGLFVRVVTPAGGETLRMTVPGRFDDNDIVHVVAQNLELQGTPGGARLEETAPDIRITFATGSGTGALNPVMTYEYRVVFVTKEGFQSPASDATVGVNPSPGGGILLSQLPVAVAPYTGRLIYRSDDGGATYTLVSELDRSATSYQDTGVDLGRTLDVATMLNSRNRARTHARLSVDPGVVVKLEGSYIHVGYGAQFIAEGQDGREVILTSRKNDQYGAGGTFDTNGDASTAAPGDWGGVYVGHTASASIDRALISFAGGVTPVESDFAGINTIEIHEASTTRITNTVFEDNANGLGGTAPGNRFNLFSHGSGTIFVRAAQPVVLDNVFRDNAGPVININSNALNNEINQDPGRSTGMVDRETGYLDNRGPLIRENLLGNNGVNGMEVRGEILTTRSVWDDADIVHVLRNEVYVPDMHTDGGLFLKSSSDESLVIKAAGANAGFSASGEPLDIVDRIGGAIHIVGQPGRPVVITDIDDDSVGAGFDLDGFPMLDTGNDGATTGSPGAWRGISLEEFSHDRNVGIYVEAEPADANSPSTNGTANPEVIGAIAKDQKSGDETLRLGFDIYGTIDTTNDTDVYSFSAEAGTHVWIDIDRSTQSLDTVIELLNSDGDVLAISDNTLNEENGDWNVVTFNGTRAFPLEHSQFLGDDMFSLNQRDAGFRVLLPGTTGTRGDYSIRVRSSNIDSTTADPRADLEDPSKLFDGKTTGTYKMQIRLQETDEFPGSTIQYADIRFATDGIRIVGQPIHSPLIGESEEVEGRLTNVGNLFDSDRAALAIRGNIASPTDVDYYTFEVNYTSTQQIAGVSTEGAHVPVTFDLDYADGFARANTTIAIFNEASELILIGRDSNIAEDQPGPLGGSDVDDLTRGSVGTFDPFIGTVELPGGIYTLAVSNALRIPQPLTQFSAANSAFPNLRLEPVNSTERISEERFGAADSFTSASAPLTDLFTVTGGNLDASHVVPFSLADIRLFVTSNDDNTDVDAVNPFTGASEGRLGSFSPRIRDAAMRPDGQFYAFTTGPNSGTFTSGNTGNYVEIHTGDASLTNVGDDGITVNRDNLDANGLLTPGDDNVTANGNAAIRYNAMVFTGTGTDDLFAVGDRDNNGTNPANSSKVNTYDLNILYQFDATDGTVIGNGANRTNDSRAYSGAGTTQREIGQVVVDGVPLTTSTLTGMARVGGTTYAVTNTGRLMTISLGSAAATEILNTDLAGIPFAGLAAGPDEVEGGRYANLLFGISTTGTLFAFDTAGILQPIFVDAQTSVATGIGGVTGLDFGTLERNLWNISGHRGDNGGHGIEARYDNSVAPEEGGAALYFGNTRNGAAAGNQNNLDPDVIRDVNFPGGAHGSVVSNEFSLAGYSKHDKPTIYFNYFLETDGTNSTQDPAVMQDSFRVFVGEVGGSWDLIGTNNSLNGEANAATLQGFPDVGEVFDNTGQWRQARVDLSNFAGLANLRLRFDFSTGGSMDVGNADSRGHELYALDAAELSDGQTFVIDGQSFELELGRHLTTSSGAAVDGESFMLHGETFTYGTAAGPNVIQILATDTADIVAQKTAAAINARAALDGTSLLIPAGFAEGDTITVNGTVFTLRANPVAATDIRADDGALPGSTRDTAGEVALQAARVINSQLGGGTAFAAGNWVELPITTAGNVASSRATTISDRATRNFDFAKVTGNRVTVRSATVGDLTESSGALLTAGGAGVPGGVAVNIADATWSANEVAVAIRQALADRWSDGDISLIKGAEDLIQVIGHDVTNPGPLGFTGSFDPMLGWVGELEGDDFGNYTASNPSRRGMSNNVEGVLIDDIIIGFAERGETVINGPTSVDSFITDTFVPTEAFIAVGEYDVEIRRASDFGETMQAGDELVNALYRSIDTNDREAEFVSFTLPADPAQLVDGSTVTITDGIDTVVFQFLDVNGSTVKLPGAFAIDFDPLAALSTTSPAELLRDAINSPIVQGMLRTKASMSDGEDDGVVSTGRTIILTNVVQVTSDIPEVTASVEEFTDFFGDQNHHRDQGQIIIHSSFVSNSQNAGIVVDAGSRRFPDLPNPASVRNLVEINYDQLVTGVVISNNVIVGNNNAGVILSGDQLGSPDGVVSYARVVNNTIVGDGNGSGVIVEQGASPTILNTILADVGQGVTVRNNGGAEVVLGSLLYRVAAGGQPTSGLGGSVGTYARILSPTDTLFVDQANGNYYPAPGSVAVDSGLDSLEDRPALVTVKNPLGIGISPVLTPDLDVYGQLRGDDPTAPNTSGQGGNVFVDRGAIDRVDFTGPTAMIVDQLDFDPAPDSVLIAQEEPVRQFVIQLLDQGIGIDDLNIFASQFTLRQGGTTLVEGVDYQWRYNSASDQVMLISTTEFETEQRYEIEINNTPVDPMIPGDVDGVRDLAGNYLQPNQSDGSVVFFILVTDGVNDAPINEVPVSPITINEDEKLTFSIANGNQIQVSDADVHLAADPMLNVTIDTTDGVLTLATTTGLTFPTGDTGSNEASITFSGSVDDINAALDGLVFMPPMDYFNLLPGQDPMTRTIPPVTITITTDDTGPDGRGQVSAPPNDNPEFDIDTIDIDVIAVNDQPTFTPPANPPAIDEDVTALQTIPMFVTGMSPGPANESHQTLAFRVTNVTVLEGNLTFVNSPTISATGELTYSVAPDTNGRAEFTFVLDDFDPDLPTATSDPFTSTIVVNPINDEPSFTLANMGMVTSNEDDGSTGPVNLIDTVAVGPVTATDETDGANFPATVQLPSFEATNPVTTVGNLLITSFQVTSNGFLTYEAAPDTAGEATFTIRVVDSGPDSDHPMDDNTSDYQTVTIKVAAQPDPPVPVTPDYVIDDGDDLNLDASGTTDPDLAYAGMVTEQLFYSWDINNDGMFDIVSSTNSMETVTAATLGTLGLTVPGDNTITLRVTDTFSGTSVDTTATLTILTVDYGHAPDMNYGTTKANNGAAHTIVPGLFLGAGLDAETDGPAVDAGEDDGIVFDPVMQADGSIALQSFFTATASDVGKLDIWIDYNNDGDFDPGEHLNNGTSFDVVAGPNNFTFTIPAGAVTTGMSGIDTWARARLTSAGGAAPTGRVDDGEVEDYQIHISPLLDAEKHTFSLPMWSQTSDLTPLLQWYVNPGPSTPGANETFELEVRDAANQPVIQQTGLTSTSYQVGSALAPGMYTAYVTAFNRGGVAGPVSDPHAFEVVALTVTAPTGDLPNGTPTVEWTPVNLTDHYELEIQSALTGAPVLQELNIPGTETTYDVVNELPIGAYRVRVRAIEHTTGQPGDWSAFSLFDVRTAPQVTAPIGIIGDGTPTVTWNGVPGALTYDVRINDVTEDVAPLLTLTGIVGMSVDVAQELPLGEYTVEVRGITGANFASAWSPAETFIVAIAPTISQPAGREPDSTPTIVWNAVNGADNYDVEIVDTNAGSALVYSATGLTGTQHTIPNNMRLPLGDYEVRIRANNVPAQSSSGGVVSVLSAASAFTVSTPPEILLPYVGIYDTTPEVTWNEPFGAVTNELMIRDIDLNQVVFTQTGISGASFTIPDGSALAPARYSAVVRSIGDHGVASDYSTQHFFQIGAAPVAKGPSEGLGSAPYVKTNQSRPTLTATQSLSGVTHEFWLSSRSEGQTVEVVADLDTSSWTVPFDLEAGAYRYWVRAKTDIGELSDWSQPYDFMVTTPPVVAPIAPTFNPRPEIGIAPGTVQPEVDYYRWWLNRVDLIPAETVLIEAGVVGTQLVLPNDLAAGRYKVWAEGYVEGSNPQAPIVVTSWSAGVEFEIGGRPVATSIGVTTDGTPLLQWSQVEEAVSYEVYLAAQSTYTTPIIRQAGLTGTSYQVTADLPPDTYIFWVRSRAANGQWSPWSLTSQGRFTIVPATVPIVDPIATSNNQTPTFTWSAVTNAVRYNIYVAPVSNTGNALINDQTADDSTSYSSAVALPAGGEYRVWVQAILANNSLSAWSVPVRFTITAEAGGEQNILLPETMLATLATDAAAVQVDDIDVSLMTAAVSEPVAEVSQSDGPQHHQKSQAVRVNDGEQEQDSDDVMSDWDAAIWAEESAPTAAAVAEAVAESREDRTSRGFLAGLAMLTPSALRRRRKKQ